jgi:LCP family protein required for cell wall assembly
MTRQQHRHRMSGAWIAVLAVLLIVVAVLLLLWVNREGTPAPAAAPSSAAASPTPTFNAGLLDHRLTVLVIGTDVNAARASAGEAANTDSLILASIDGGQSEMTLISLPRDMTDIPMPDGSTWQGKVNGIEPANDIETLVAAVSALFDVPIDHHVQVDMDDLAALVDAVDGVEVNPDTALRDPKVNLDIPAGRQLLHGREALAYARTRVDTDYGRAARQQEVLLQLVSRLVAPDARIDLAALIDGLDSLETDLPLDDLPTLVEIARRAQSADATRQVLTPPRFISFEGDRGDGRGYILEPKIEAIRDYARAQLGS